MIPRACRTCGEPPREDGGRGCACGAESGAEDGVEASAGGPPGRERPLLRPYVMKAPGPVGGWDGDGDGNEGAGPPEGHGPVAPAPDSTVAASYGPIGAAPEGPADADLGLFADDPAAPRAARDPYHADDPRDPYDPGRRGDRLAARRRRRLTLVLTVGGVLAALSVGLLGSGLFSDDGEDDRAVPKPDTITAVPTGGGTKPGPDDAHSGAPTAPADGDDPAEPSATASDRTGSASADPDGAPAERTEAGQVTAAPPDSGSDPTTPADPDPGTTPEDPDPPPPPPTLREGDKGPEVVELQKRLIDAGYDKFLDSDGEYGFFTGQAVEGFQRDNDIDGDERGVYGPQTRRALESMTKEP
ncbi:peptidoglycan-binding protein [Streptomyces sp. NBC_01808]|uniref:peptidoglycan-binding protein n=1 Tax=Streptomyces sp. NBC_01808 TaxID=2975947 RepID=UPI002DDC6E26|nr:peptidoglycan-binding protein [Streptomyces sp. NBC_01808]WSA37546.1 peptidoglycan-binding protein [Streptomyces sp. NBC_01808]